MGVSRLFKGCFKFRFSMGVSKVLRIYLMAVLNSLHRYLGKVSKTSLRGDCKIAALPQKPGPPPIKKVAKFPKNFIDPPNKMMVLPNLDLFWDFSKNLFRTLPRVNENVLTPLKTLKLI